MSDPQTVSAFDMIAATIPTPVLIATTHHQGQSSGCLVGFSSQCSIDPLRYLVCLSTANQTYETARDAAVVVVHFVRADDDGRALARLFGEATGRDVDKFSLCQWQPGPGGVPVLDGCDWFAGTIEDLVDFGDHVGFIIEPTGDGRAEDTGERYLTFRDVRDFDAGNPA